MKKMILGLGLGIVLSSMISATAISLYDLKNNTAEVEQVRGVYVFMDSKPVKEYEYLGTVKSAGVVASKDYEFLMPKMVERTLKEYPKAEGVIFKGDVYSCEAIVFKK